MFPVNVGRPNLGLLSRTIQVSAASVPVGGCTQYALDRFRIVFSKMNEQIRDRDGTTAVVLHQIMEYPLCANHSLKMGWIESLKPNAGSSRQLKWAMGLTGIAPGGTPKIYPALVDFILSCLLHALQFVRPQ